VLSSLPMKTHERKIEAENRSPNPAQGGSLLFLKLADTESPELRLIEVVGTKSPFQPLTLYTVILLVRQALGFVYAAVT